MNKEKLFKVIDYTIASTIVIALSYFSYLVASLIDITSINSKLNSKKDENE